MPFTHHSARTARNTFASAQTRRTAKTQLIRVVPLLTASFHGKVGIFYSIVSLVNTRVQNEKTLNLDVGGGAAPRAQVRGLFVLNPRVIKIITVVRDCVAMSGSVIGGATHTRCHHSYRLLVT